MLLVMPRTKIVRPTLGKLNGRPVNKVLRDTGLKKVLEVMSGACTYINDIVIYNDSWEEHFWAIKELFGRLRRARVTARPMKCLLGANSTANHQDASEILPSSPRISRLLLLL